MATGRIQPLALIDKCIGSRIWVITKVNLLLLYFVAVDFDYMWFTICSISAAQSCIMHHY
jgi:hypothetical protein